MEKLMNLLHIISLLFIAISSILLSFVDLFVLKVGLVCFVLILLLILFIKTRGILRISYTTFFILSILLTYYNKIPLDEMIDAMLSHTIFITLFVCTPLIKIPIESGNYLEKLIPKMTKVPAERLSPLLIVSNFILCSFLNVGGIRVMGEFFADTMKKTPVAFSAILSRPFSAAAFWTPYFSAFSIAIAYSSSRPGYVLGLGLLFTVVVLTIWIIRLSNKKKETESHSIFSKEDITTITRIIFYFTLLILSVIVVSHFTTYSVILIISVLSIVFSFLWSFLFRRIGQYVRALKRYVSKDLLNIREEAFLFISIGFFANTLLNLHWEIHLPTLSGSSVLFVFLFIILFNITVVAIALTGIHHLVTITILSATLNWQEIGMQPVIFALTILLSWWLSSMISPFSPPNLITARIVNRTPFQVGVITNGFFAVYVLLGAATYLTILNFILS